MGKNIYLLIALMFFIVSGIAFYAFHRSETLLTIVGKNDQHLHSITIANKISNFSKRAEGHLFLYLMLGDPIDKEKFYKRSEALKITAQQLQALSIEGNSEIFENILYQVEAFTLTGNQLLSLYRESLHSSTNFPFKIYAETLTRFHGLSSSLRRSGENYVERSANYLKVEKSSLIANINKENVLIGTCLLLSTLLLIIVFQQARKLFKVSEKLHQLSYTDGLTGIANRRFFEEVFLKEWKRACREDNFLSLMMIDIDYFKQYNDNYGHSAGDLCLKKVSRALQKCLKRPTDFVARYGGEEFVIVIPGTSNVITVAEQCRKAVEELHIPHSNSQASNVVTITLGIGTIKPVINSSAKEMLQQIDQALYRGKEGGRNRIQAI